MKNLSITLLASLTLSASLLHATLSTKIQNSSLVVYNSNIALVHEERDLTLNTSDTTIVYEDVAQSLQTDSINVEISPSVTLYSQQYRFDTLSQQKLLKAHIGKKVEVRLLKNSNEFQVMSATLLAYNGTKSIVGHLIIK